MSIFRGLVKKTIALFLVAALMLCIAPCEVAYGTGVNAAAVPYDDEYVLIKLRSSPMVVYSARTESSIMDCVSEMEYIFSNNDISFYGLGENNLNTNNGDWYAAKLADGVTPEEAARKLIGNPNVLAVEFNCFLELLGEVGTPDPGTSEQWHLERCGIPEARQYLAENFNLPGGRSDIIVAVIDSGVKYDHSDLKDNIWVNTGEIPGNGKDDDGNGYTDDVHGWDFSDGTAKGNNDPYDTNGHGTHCAGIIAGVRNGEGIEGVAFGVKIMPVKVSGKTFTVLNVINGIKYACENGADIVNMSLGMTNKNYKSVHEIIEKYADNVIFVAAAGNSEAGYENVLGSGGWPNVSVDGADESVVTYPAAYPEVIGVMSSDENPSAEPGCEGDMKSDFSRWDPIPDDGVDYELIAPGGEIYSTGVSSGKYQTGSGTSFAAPFVSGCFALMLTKYKGRDDFSTEEIKRIVTDTGDRMQGVTVIYEDYETGEKKSHIYWFNSINIANALNYRRDAAVLYKRCYMSDGQQKDIEPVELIDGALSNIRFTYSSVSGEVETELPSENGQYLVTGELIGNEGLYYKIINPQVTLTIIETEGDYNGDNTVDDKDLEEFAYFMYAQEQADGRYCELADLNGDGYIGTKDLILLSRKMIG